MITTDFIPGSPCWIELGTPDVEATVAFYRGVIGWDAVSAGPDTGGYMLFQKDGKAVGGVGPLMTEGTRSVWTVYFTSPDVDATARTAEGIGGTVHTPPTDVLDLGRMMEVADPQGGRFGVWQAGTFPGFEITDAPGSVCWTELYTPDAKGAKEFYADLFGWGFQDMGMPGDSSQTYTLLAPSGAGEDRMHGGLMQADTAAMPGTGGRAYWHPVLAVNDCDAAVAQVRVGGGQVLMGPEDAEGVGRLCVVHDPFGAELVLLTPSPE
ncbi:VOC family protein [Nocardiopsis gilva YIM 90087]|uniref:VOC family protein n=1 Tax=Nocardiopsis gilva YIM 90087 TaxID=1235441 RepID=A0A223S816_9ACTN|nr:VOC family protein [Nocardiopsis gilva]ASU84246.1 VOC family protein [Nocardiopsis gilva YIM 90087]